MGRRAYNWERSGWLPALEVVEYPRLADWREKHEAAIAAVEAAGENAGARHEAIDELFAVVEAGFRDLEAHFEDEIGEAIDDAAEKVTPKVAEPHDSMALANDDPEAKKQGEREAKERAKLRPRRAALDRDTQAVSRVRLILSGGTQQALYSGQVLPIVLAQVAEVRDETGAVAVP